MAKYQKIIIGAPPMNFGGTEVRDAFVLINHAIEGLEEVTAKVENAGGIPGNSDNNFTDDLKAKLEALPTADELSKTTVTEAEKAAITEITTTIEQGGSVMTAEQAEELSKLVNASASTKLQEIDLINTSVSKLETSVDNLNQEIGDLQDQINQLSVANTGAYRFDYVDGMQLDAAKFNELNKAIDDGYMIIIRDNAADENNTVLEIQNSEDGEQLQLKYWDDNGVYSISIAIAEPHTTSKEEVLINADTTWVDVGEYEW